MLIIQNFTYEDYCDRVSRLDRGIERLISIVLSHETEANKNKARKFYRQTALQIYKDSYAKYIESRK